MKAKRPRLKKVERESSAIVPEQIEKLREMFPEVVSEGKVDFDKLRQTLGDEVDAGPERYSFTWAGKRDSIKLLQVPSRATLLPCPDESIDWDKTNNVFIEGENLEVLKLLYKAYYGRVKMIYIDPPYNTGKDFIYPDNYADPLDTYLRLTGQKDSEGNVLTSNPETSGRYHSSWLSMMYPRLFVARQLLRDDGVIFVSIDDNEVHNLRAAMNEVFGEENFIGTATRVAKKTSNKGTHFAPSKDYVVVYGRDIAAVDMLMDPVGEAYKARFAGKDSRGDFATVGLYQAALDPMRGCTNQRYWVACPDGSFAIPPGNVFPSSAADGATVPPRTRADRVWRWAAQSYLSKKQLLVFKKTPRSPLVRPDGKRSDWNVYTKYYLTDRLENGVRPRDFLDDLTNDLGTQDLNRLDLADVFDFPKPAALVERLTSWLADPDTLVLDFFAGSCSAAQAVLNMNKLDQGNRRFVLVQLPEATGRKDFPTVADIGKERIRRVIAKMKKEQAGKLATDAPQDLGFRVYKLTESNMKPWKGTVEKDPEKYAKTMEMFLDPLVEGWKPENVIAEVALKTEGFGLNCRVEQVSHESTKDTKKKNGSPVIFKVTDEDKEQFFHICLADKVRLEDVKFLNLTRDVLFVCRDVALDDETAANLALQCRLRTI